MPRVKTIKINFGGEQHNAHINVSSKGVFSCKLPPYVSYGIGLANHILTGNTLAEVEDVLTKTYERYLNEATLLEPAIRIMYGGNSHLNDKFQGLCFQCKWGKFTSFAKTGS